MSALSISHLSVVLGGRTVIDDVSVDVEAGSVTVVVGRSGAGKSVLFKAAAGLLPRSAGDVVVSTPPLIFVHQDPALFEDRSALENLGFFAFARGDPARVVEERLDRVITSLRLGPILERPAGALSPAEARRVALGRALVLRPGVLIVDEPTTGLDPAATDDVSEALAGEVAGAALIVITHHPRTIDRLARGGSRILRVEDGRLTPLHMDTAA